MLVISACYIEFIVDCFAEGLIAYFSTYGEVEDVAIMKDATTDKPRYITLTQGVPFSWGIIDY